MDDPATPAFRDEPLLVILAMVQAELARGAQTITIRVLDPQHARGRYAGERVELAGATYVHRGFRVWVDLAERLGLRLLTPRTVEPPLVELQFERLAAAPRAPPGDPTEKYGTASELARTSKLEEPGFVLDFADALDRVKLPAEPRILELGVNTGDAFALVCSLAPELRAQATFVGVDHSGSALEAARARFPEDNFQFVRADLGDLGKLRVLDGTALPSGSADGGGSPAVELARFDLVISIATLQSPGLDDRDVLRRIVQSHLASDGAVILGVPNCRYRDGEQEYGARMKNFRQPELGLLVKDVAFYRKYLQQHHRDVYVTGKNYLLVTAVASGARD